MKSGHITRNVSRGTIKIAAFVLSLTPFFAVGAYAQVDATAKPETTTTITPYSLFQDSVLTSSTNTVNVTRVPVVDSKGVLHYWDVALLFDVNSSGELTLAAGYPMITGSASPITSGFKAGTYVAPNGATIVVTGPGVTKNGATEWSLAQSGTTCSFPYSATWYVGSISSNPLYPRLKADAVTSSAYSYGILGTSSSCGNNDWDGGALLGFTQTGNSLTIVTFSYGGTDDYATPIAQLTYTYKP